MLNFDTVRQWDFGPMPHAYDEREAMLYALAAGAGRDPLDPCDLRYVYEKDLQVLPSMAASLCAPGPWARDPRTGIDIVRVVHGEQDIVVHEPLPARAELHARAQVTAILDKGVGKGAVVEVTRDLLDQGGTRYVTQRHRSFCRGDGGFSQSHGQSLGRLEALPSVPEREADEELEWPICPRAALFYRLLGDFNPLHVDPAFAREAGYPKPILHGLCMYGMATQVVLRHRGDNDARRLRRLAVRFSAPAFPGETLRFRLWYTATELGHPAVHLQARVDARDVLVLDRGWFELTAV